MKCYFKTLDSETKGNIKEKFLNSNECVLYKKANKITNLCIFGIIFSILTFTFDFVYYSSIFSLILDGFLLIISTIYLFKMNCVKLKEINKYALKNKKTDK